MPYQSRGGAHPLKKELARLKIKKAWETWEEAEWAFPGNKPALGTAKAVGREKGKNQGSNRHPSLGTGAAVSKRAGVFPCPAVGNERHGRGAGTIRYSIPRIQNRKRR